MKLFTQKVVISSQKYEFGIPDPGSRGQKGTGSRIRIRNTVLLCASAISSGIFSKQEKHQRSCLSVHSMCLYFYLQRKLHGIDKKIQFDSMQYFSFMT
jgi:hypothetical protein